MVATPRVARASPSDAGSMPAVATIRRDASGYRTGRFLGKQSKRDPGSWGR
ncbi:hypothetical protein GCM10022251_55860 [Phytohabitans flavus]|uniref:Uncharacterized protein n=1 Tax=Phytohabitans flavus TaxID=1076124 RepID=A0A6F8XQB2_9ACTN|nr:hypothetical protein Pflav_024160 [Phytohabitans flavus]